MGCRKLACWSEEKPFLRCVWKSGEYQKNGVNWYDYGIRFYDPSLGWWHVQNRFADVYLSLSPYHYGNNNPIKILI